LWSRTTKQASNYLLHERSERIDELNGQLDRLRAVNQRLGLENELLAAMLAAPQLNAAILSQT
jgi:septal ring factor EnvC (AmiA/AmiB activator)